MTLEQDNPYKPSGVLPTPAPRSQASLVRGIACALPAAVVGFALPFVLLSILTLVRRFAVGYPHIDMEADFQAMPSTLLWPGIGCSIIFALAAILNYSPA